MQVNIYCRCDFDLLKKSDKLLRELKMNVWNKMQANIYCRCDFDLLKKSDKLLRELKNLDNQKW